MSLLVLFVGCLLVCCFLGFFVFFLGGGGGGGREIAVCLPIKSTVVQKW